MEVTELVGTILLSGTGGVVLKTGIENLLNRRKLGAETDKVDADAADVVTRTALALVEPLGRRIRELEDEVDELRSRVREATQELDDCRAIGRRQAAEIQRLRQPRSSTEKGPLL